MAESTPDAKAARLLVEGFKRAGPEAAALSDPIVDTPMIVTLEQLRPYEHNPRVTRNPLYDDIKASIRERGLDAPPAITRRPGEPHYIIRNGGNTRLAILRELWSDTKEERFFRIPCLFRPWSTRGEIVALTGHLAENELHGGLSFIERALGVEKARELYEQEDRQPLSQSALSRRLTADGYPVAQPHISRMQEAVRYLLPAIPHLLYAGLGRPQIERLVTLRRAAARLWESRAATQRATTDFSALFQDVLAGFDGEPDALSIQRVQDELVGQMAEQLGTDYDTLLLDMHDTEHRQLVLASEPASPAGSPMTASPAAAMPSPPSVETPAPAEAVQATATTAASSVAPSGGTDLPNPHAAAPASAHLDAHVVSPAPTTDRLQSIQQLVASELGDARPDFATNVVQAIPVQAGGLYPISDVWYIEPGLDAPDRLRVHIAQLAREIAGEAGIADAIEATDEGIGFVCNAPTGSERDLRCAHAIVTLLRALDARRSPSLPEMRSTDELGRLLIGHGNNHDGPSIRLSDAALVKLYRLLRLARRLVELVSGQSTDEATTFPS
ncbi:ParB family protein [Burkholderia gladioli]|uniref:ParB family protein n=1 Tax=Burkholderia gladioli TaxID=28095 RepID=UPI00163EB623|nr:ParB family protein [Burkholderia gladioli]